MQEISASLIKIWNLGDPLDYNMTIILTYGLDILSFFIIYKYNGSKDILLRYITLYTTLMLISCLIAFIVVSLPVVFLAFDAYFLKMYIAFLPALMPFFKFCFEPFLTSSIILNFALIYYFRKLKKIS